jgi:hypothetical protein
MLFSVEDDSGLIQAGPSYDQYPGPAGDPIPYTAEFRLKSPEDNPRGGDPPDSTLCVLMVVGDGEVLAETTVYNRDFENCLIYRTFDIDYFVTMNPIQFQIYWSGNRALYIDYVKVYDQDGWDLIDNPNHTVANNIKAYVDSPWVHTTIPETGNTVVYRWYLNDEPWYIDLLEPARYIDSLLRQVSSERVGYQIVNAYSDETFIHEYFLRHDPEEYFVDTYPTHLWGAYFSGEEFQNGVSQFVGRLDTCRIQAEDHQKDFWVTIQTHFWGYEVVNPDSCPYGTAFGYDEKWYCSKMLRAPTGNEVRLQTFMALCYGVDAILHFNYSS